jgi:hypothetical protein
LALLLSKENNADVNRNRIKLTALTSIFETGSKYLIIRT